MTKNKNKENKCNKMNNFYSFFPIRVLALLFFTLLTRLTYFMVWPFLAIILTKNFSLSPVHIGIIMSGSAVLSVVLGFYGGYLSDNIGRKWLLFLGCILAIIGYTCIAVAMNLILISLGLLLIGVSFSWIDAPSRALMSDLLKDKSRRELVLQIRYLSINIAAVLGPLIGITLGLNSQKSTFFFTAASYVPFLIFSLLFIESNIEKNKKTGKEFIFTKKSSLEVAGIILKDRVFILSIICCFMCYLVFSQIETVLPQYLLILNSHTAIDLVTYILITNAITILISQYYIVIFLEKLPLWLRISIGSMVFFFSQLLFWFNTNDSILSWVLVIIIFSIGEAILLPNFSILLDRLSPEKYRGSYLGASMFVVLGQSLGPLIGGFLLQYCGRYVFIFMASLCLIMFVIMYINKNIINKNLESVR